MTTSLLPDQTYGDEFRQKLKTFEHINGARNTINNYSSRTSKANEVKSKSKIKNSTRNKTARRTRYVNYQLNTEHDSGDSENGFNIKFNNDELSLYSFTSDSEEEKYCQKYINNADPLLQNDGYNQEMSRLLRGIKVWETSGCDTIIRKQASHHVGGSESSTTNKKSLHHRRSTSWDAFRARQKTKHFLSKNNIRPEFFCQYKHFIG